jgi:dihydrofolate synthase / folylpolyglutamate synthase
MLNKYSECTEWLFSQFPSYQHLGASAYKPGLENTQAILEHVGNPETDLRFIHVAGTNGKGSTCAFIASFLQQAGYRVGSFTSPHLVDFRERIRINGQAIHETEVIQFCNQVRETALDLSFFEITLAMALVHFKRESCDYVVLETGMGGRLDATNVVTPLLAVITNIGLDHQAFLGDSLAEIAGEKAGIIKPLVPVLCGEEREELLELFRNKAKKLEAPMTCSTACIDDPTNALPAYQRKNAAIAMEALHILGINTEGIDAVATWNTLFEQTGFLGRLFPSGRYQKLWYDASHNADGFITTMKALKGMGHPLPIVIFGASNDKTLHHLSTFIHDVDHWIFCEFTNPRSYRGEPLKKAVDSLGLTKIQFTTDVNDAIQRALKMRSESQGILVTGSFFLLSDCEEIQEVITGQLTQ